MDGSPCLGCGLILPNVPYLVKNRAELGMNLVKVKISIIGTTILSLVRHWKIFTHRNLPRAKPEQIPEPTTLGATKSMCKCHASMLAVESRLGTGKKGG